MTPFFMLACGLRYAFAGFLFFAVLAELALCLYRHIGQGWRCSFSDDLLFGLLLLLLSYITAASDKENMRYLLPVPWALLPILSTVVLVRVAIGMQREYRQSRHRLSPDSVRQALNNLNCGICFADQSGRIVLINHRMGELIASLTGSYPQMIGELREALRRMPSLGNPSAREDEPILYRFSDGRVWRFHTISLSRPSLYGFTQTTAQDVTELYDANEHLKNDNEELRLVNEKMQKMYDRLADRIREQETLNLKMRIHNDIGASLIAISKMMDTDALEDVEKQLELLENAVSYFSNDLPAVPVTLDELYKKAAEMHVKLEIDGDLPQSAEQRRLVICAVHECVTNCVYHAQGSFVRVETGRQPQGYIVTITNDGKAPKKPIKEGGGLSSLRKSVEEAGGEMQIFSAPVFSLVLRLTRKEPEV